MKRTNLRDRVRLLTEKEIALEHAADEWAKEANTEWRDRRRVSMLEAAVDYAETARRYLGGKS